MIDCFENEYAFLSNFYEHPIEYKGIIYPTNEHFFQAMKTLDSKEHMKIATAPTPGKSKRLGRSVNLRSDWEEVKEDIMLLALRLKFSDRDMAKKLLATGDECLVEGTRWHDRYWGICSCPVCGGRGKNRLGYLLIKVREELKENEMVYF